MRPIPTIYEIAKRLNISPATVSRALTGHGYVRKELRDEIMRVAEELDYQPNSLARSLITRQTHTIGLVLPDITNPFFPGVARGVEDVAHRHGYNVILCNSDGNARKEAAYLKVLRSKQVDGIVFTTSQVGTSHIRQLLAARIPVVLADRRMNIEADYVVVDNIEGSYQATQHLVHLGHSEIGFITGPRGVTTGIERIEGYKRALQENGIEIRSELIVEGDYRQNSGYRLAEKLMRRHKPPTAIFACNDLMAIGVLEWLEQRGMRVPEDVAVVGYDGTLLSAIVHLTTVAQPMYELGALACEFLIARIQEKDRPLQQAVLRPQLIVRDSSIVRNKVKRSSGLE